MLLAKVQYRNPTTGQQACIRLHLRSADYAVAVDIGGESDGIVPARLATAASASEARQLGKQYHKELTTHYGMQRVS